MINFLDLIIIGLVLFYLLRNAGGILKTIKNLIVILFILIALGIFSAFLLEQKVAEPIHKTLKDSYFVKLSYALIKIAYPTIEKEIPKVDVFIKEKIVSTPTSETKGAIPKKSLPRIKIGKGVTL
ncbi:MAG: hypothetical protein ACPL4K_01170 [Candidatus Margulisiibacteriota bacterium]